MSSYSLIDKIGEYSLSGRTLYDVLLDYKCCANELCDGRVQNCLTEKTKIVQSFRSFETFRIHMWKKHNIDIVIPCAERLAAKQDREAKYDQIRNKYKIRS